MNQIMRLRRVSGSDQHIEDRNNGYRHEHAFVKNIKRNGLLHEADLLPDSYGGKFHPRAVPELITSLPTAMVGLRRGKMTVKKALLHPHKAPKEVKRLFEVIDGREQRVELNIYVSGKEDDLLDEPVKQPVSVSHREAGAPEPPLQSTDSVKDKSPTFPGPDESGKPADSDPDTESES
jgi:succinate dehydrogenase / fumarate reductase iron-sulfur subunit